MKTRLILAMLSLCFFFANISIAQKLNKAYVNDEYKYSIVFPDNWVIEPRKELMYHVISCQTPDTAKVKQGAIKIIIQNAGGEENLESVAENMSSGIQKFLSKDFVVNKKEKVMLNAIEFYLYDYSYNFKREDLPERQKNINYLYLLNQKLYMVMFWGNESYYEKNKEMIMKSIESFKLLK